MGIAGLLFLLELFIAAFLHDRIIRPYGGDFLVVILLYCLLRGMFDIKVKIAAILVLLFAFALELLQYFNVVNRLGLQRARIARIVIGTSFEWLDIVAYSLGIALVLWTELIATKKGGWPSAI